MPSNAIRELRLHHTLITHDQPTKPSLLSSAVQSSINTAHYTNQINRFYLAALLSEKNRQEPRLRRWEYAGGGGYVFEAQWMGLVAQRWEGGIGACVGEGLYGGVDGGAVGAVV
ncbi:hypothetical protein K458DRAFT_206366 [Lentithecium fluviatile CBS 122367]|uniref:Uncharacterized protein n=1 Tax=Lentithecium fluviatile CBS 122367 TaxID=1168545 RepID=A0A6G1ICM9_9PLEO|nr:hypothetical protein K458DRAFT_206366 [Lentithecium fluviatile CBS 122367]